MDRASQSLYHALIRTGALGEGSAISPLDPEVEKSVNSELVYRTPGKDWVLVADPEASRDTFLRLAQAAMGHALDLSQVAAETGIVFTSIVPELKTASDRLHIASFKVSPLEETSTCGFCGSAMTAPSRVKGWQGCARCQRLLKEDSRVQICPGCLGTFSASPGLEGELRALITKDAPAIPDLALCPLCRGPDGHQKITVIDLVMKAVGEGRVTLDQVRDLKMPGEYLQLLNLRVQLRRT